MILNNYFTCIRKSLFYTFELTLNLWVVIARLNTKKDGYKIY